MQRSTMRTSKALTLAAVAAAVFGAPQPADAEDIPGDVTSGRLLAGKVCAKCHDTRRNGSLSPLPDAPPFQKVADAPATTELSLRVFLQSPHKLMPDFHLTPEERDDAISYILSLKRKKK